jgi:hypothetical protein
MEGLMEPSPLSRCHCTIVDETILFCALHNHAETLLEACQYVRKFMATLKAARSEDQNFIQELVLPYLENAISAASERTV